MQLNNSTVSNPNTNFPSTVPVQVKYDQQCQIDVWKLMWGLSTRTATYYDVCLSVSDFCSKVFMSFNEARSFAVIADPINWLFQEFHISCQATLALLKITAPSPFGFPFAVLLVCRIMWHLIGNAMAPGAWMMHLHEYACKVDLASSLAKNLFCASHAAGLLTEAKYIELHHAVM